LFKSLLQPSFDCGLASKYTEFGSTGKKSRQQGRGQKNVMGKMAS